MTVNSLATLQGIPPEVFVQHILTRLSAKDLLSISRTSKYCKLASQDERYLPQKVFFATGHVFFSQIPRDNSSEMIAYFPADRTLLFLSHETVPTDSLRNNTECFSLDVLSGKISTLIEKQHTFNTKHITKDEVVFIFNVPFYEEVRRYDYASKELSQGNVLECKPPLTFSSDGKTYARLNNSGTTVQLWRNGVETLINLSIEPSADTDVRRKIVEIALWDHKGEQVETWLVMGFHEISNSSFSSLGFKMQILKIEEKNHQLSSSILRGEPDILRGMPDAFICEGDEVAICYRTGTGQSIEIDIFNLVSKKIVSIDRDIRISLNAKSKRYKDIYIYDNKIISVYGSGDAYIVLVYDTKTGRFLKEINVQGELKYDKHGCITHAVSGNFIVIGRNKYPYIKCFDLTTGTLIATFPLGIGVETRSLNFEYRDNEAYLVVEQVDKEFQKLFLLFSSKKLFEGAARQSIKAVPHG
jgi:hypothetical protein